ncbi:MAG: hypothetical protein CUN55_09765 [Phototrophicales bacterium]|nr:MAG: hypothetical protein CUN55_09765 [Phototrophicales bacterium]
MKWQTLLFSQVSDQSVLAEQIRANLKVQGYKPYDPFPGGLGSPIGKVLRLRMFLAPLHSRWARICIAPQDELPHALLETLELSGIFLQVLDDEAFKIQYIDAQNGVISSWQALEGFLAEGKTVADLEAAAQKPALIQKQSSSLNLPPDIEQMANAKGVNMTQVDKMMGKMTRRLLGKEQESETLQQAKGSLSQTAAFDWNAPSGQRLMAVMACLAVPQDYWREPSWDALTTAYQVARQRQRGQGDLLPIDATALEAVPNALEYTLLYFSKKIT